MLSFNQAQGIIAKDANMSKTYVPEHTKTPRVLVFRWKFSDSLNFSVPKEFKRLTTNAPLLITKSEQMFDNYLL